MRLLCAFLSRLEILFLSLSAVGIKDRSTAFDCDAINSIVLVNSNIDTFCNRFLSTRDYNSNGFKESVSKDRFLTERNIGRQTAIYDLESDVNPVFAIKLRLCTVQNFCEVDFIEFLGQRGVKIG